MRLVLAILGACCAWFGFANAQVASHCQARPTLRSLIADMVAQNLSSDLAFWSADMTQVHLLLSDSGQLVLEELRIQSPNYLNQDMRDLIRSLEARFDLPLPEGGPLLPTLKSLSPDIAQVSTLINRLNLLQERVDFTFDPRDLFEDITIDVRSARALWAQARAYAQDEAALAFVEQQGLILPRAVRLTERFRVAPDAMSWHGPALLDAIMSGHMTWVSAENIVWGWFQAGDRIRIQSFAQAFKEALLRLRADFVAGRPNFNVDEPFSGYFSSWQRWEDLSARLLLMIGQRGAIPAVFFHQTFVLGLGESEPNVAALDASQLFTIWYSGGYQPLDGFGEALIAHRSDDDVRKTQDMIAFFQVLVLGSALGRDRLIDLLERFETLPEVRWLGGPLLMEAFLALDERDLALRAAEVSAATQVHSDAPYAYVIPLVRTGQIALARAVLEAFHRQACSRLSGRSNRTYGWIDWLPLMAALEWRIPVSRLNGI